MWLLLFACAEPSLDEPGATAVFDALSVVNESVFAMVWSRTRPIEGDTAEDAVAAKSMQWHTAADGGTFEGTVEGPGSWTGTVTLNGAYTAENFGTDWSYAWEMDAAYDVAFGDVSLVATLGWDIVSDHDEGAAFEQTSWLSGPATARGAARGSGEVDTITRVTVSGGRYLLAVTGTVGGWDVSGGYEATSFGF
jgi:hypothetical protein